MPITKKIPVAKTGEIAPGRTKDFRFGVQNGIAYNDKGILKAYVNACTHMGGATQLNGCILRCVRHHAEFDPVTGDRLAGQAPEGTRLKPIELAMEGDDIFALLVLQDDF